MYIFLHSFTNSFILLMIPTMEALLTISSSSSPFATAPSSPRVRETTSKVPADDFPHGIYFSAPTSPAPARNSSSFVPFSWEEEETRKEDFEFEFSGQLDFARQSASAEELFESGSWIRPLKPPPRILNDGAVPALSNISPRRHPEFSSGTLSPRCRIASPVNFGFDPVKAAAMEIGRQDEEEEAEQEEQEVPLMHRYNRGREQKAVSGGLVSRREMRSLPPLRLSDVVFDNSIGDVSMEGGDRDNNSETRTTPYLTRLRWLFANTPGYGHRRWRLRDLLLFRSVSEGTGTRTLRSKEDTVTRRDDDVASRLYGPSQRRWTEGDSFRSKEDSDGSTSSKKNRARQTQSTVSRNNSVELHYTMNRAISEEMKRKTFLPYRQGVLGCLGFGGGSDGSIRKLANGVGSFTRGP